MLKSAPSHQQRLSLTLRQGMLALPLSALLCLAPLSQADTLPINSHALPGPSEGHLQIYVDPITGEFLPADQKERAEIDKSSGASGRTKADTAESDPETLRRVPPASAVSEEDIEELPGGARMIDISNRSRANFTIHRTAEGKLEGHCQHGSFTALHHHAH